MYGYLAVFSSLTSESLRAVRGLHANRFVCFVACDNECCFNYAKFVFEWRYRVDGIFLHHDERPSGECFDLENVCS